MPLLLITGYPSCGKSTICARIIAYFEARLSDDEQLHTVTDEGIESNFSRSIYGDFNKEKEVRSALRAKVQRLLHKRSLVICDSINHIKGYRYELYCLAKNTQTRYAVLYCKASLFTCQWLNAQRKDDEQYPDAILSNLFKQFEVPDQRNRWDTPLFEVRIGGKRAAESTEMKEDEFGFGLVAQDAANCSPLAERPEQMDEAELARNVNLPLEQLYATLIQGKELRANKCMKVIAPTISSTFLVELDRQTRQILDRLLTLQRTATIGDKLSVLNDDGGQHNTVTFHRLRSLPQLSRLRHQFIAYMKVHPVDDFNRISPLFVDYLNLNSE